MTSMTNGRLLSPLKPPFDHALRYAPALQVGDFADVDEDIWSRLCSANMLRRRRRGKRSVVVKELSEVGSTWDLNWMGEVSNAHDRAV